MVVTFEELFRFCLLIVSMISLVYQIAKRSDRRLPSKDSAITIINLKS